VTLVHDFAAVFENIIPVLPDAKTVAVVNGKSFAEHFLGRRATQRSKAFRKPSYAKKQSLSKTELRKEAKPFEN
jgi:ribosomal protein L35